MSRRPCVARPLGSDWKCIDASVMRYNRGSDEIVIHHDKSLMGDPGGSDDPTTPATGPGMFAWVLPGFWRRVALVSDRHCLERSFFHSVLAGAGAKVLTVPLLQ